MINIVECLHQIIFSCPISYTKTFLKVNKTRSNTYHLGSNWTQIKWYYTIKNSQFFFKRSLNLSICILAFVIRLVSIATSFVNAFLFRKEGGINIVACFAGKTCCIVNPLSTSICHQDLFVVIFHIDHVYLHHLCCLQINPI